MFLFTNNDDGISYVNDVLNTLKKHNSILEKTIITNKNAQSICNDLIYGDTLLNQLFEYGEIDMAIEFMKRFYSKLNIEVKNLYGETCFDKFCKHYIFSDEKGYKIYNISYDKYYHILELMGKTTDDYLQNSIKVNNFSGFKMIFGKHYPAQKTINSLLSYTFGLCVTNSNAREHFINMLVEYIDVISFDDFRHIVCRNHKYAIEKILSKNYFDETYINNTNILKKAIENVNARLVKIIYDNNNKLFDDMILSYMLRYWEMLFCIEFFDENNIRLENCEINNFDAFVDNIINSHQPETIKYAFDTLKINLNNYIHSQKISNPEIVKCLLNYGYNISKMPTFEFDDMTSVSDIYNIIERINDSNYVQAIIISKLNNLQEMIYDLKHNDESNL